MENEKKAADNVNIVIAFKGEATEEDKASLNELLKKVEVLAFGSSKGVAQWFYVEDIEVERMRRRISINRRDAKKSNGGVEVPFVKEKRTGVIIFRTGIIRTVRSVK